MSQQLLYNLNVGNYILHQYLLKPLEELQLFRSSPPHMFPPSSTFYKLKEKKNTKIEEKGEIQTKGKCRETNFVHIFYVQLCLYLPVAI